MADSELETGDNSLVLELSVPFQSRSEAEIVHRTLVVDPEPPRSNVRKFFRVEENKLHVRLCASEARMLRVATGALFDLLILVINTIRVFGPPKLPTVQ